MDVLPLCPCVSCGKVCKISHSELRCTCSFNKGFARSQYATIGIPFWALSVLQTWIHMLVIVGSILSYFFFALAFGALCVTCNPPSNPYGIMQKHMLDPVFYLVCVLTTCVALLPRYVICLLLKTVSTQNQRLQVSIRNEWQSTMFSSEKVSLHAS